MTSIKSKNELTEKEHFNKMASSYDTNYGYSDSFTEYKLNKKTTSFVNLIKPYIKNKKNLKILEVGCGTGEYTVRIAKHFPKTKIIGLDISNNILKVARKKCKTQKNVSFTAQSAYKTKLKNDSVDVVYGFYALHHLDIKKFKQEALRILKPNGVVYFYEPNILNPVVFLIKSNKFLKSKVGDSPDEWAINPIGIKKEFTGFNKVDILMSEYVWPLKFIPSEVLILIDKTISPMNKIPVIKYLGGSVQIFFQKK